MCLNARQRRLVRGLQCSNLMIESEVQSTRVLQLSETNLSSWQLVHRMSSGLTTWLDGAG